jgi:hypothetical protein
MPDERALSELMVNDRFWLEQGRELVKATLTKPEAAAAELQKGIAWLWTIYSASALVAGTLMRISPGPFLIALLVLPTVLLILAFIVVSRVQTPVLVEFDARIPAEIAAMLSRAAARKHTLLSLGYGIVAAAAVATAVAIGLILAEPRPKESTLDATLVSGPTSAEVQVWGVFPADTLVHLKLTTTGAAGDASVISHAIKVPQTGQFQKKFSVDGKASYRAVGIWNEGKNTRMLSVPVERVAAEP